MCSDHYIYIVFFTYISPARYFEGYATYRIILHFAEYFLNEEHLASSAGKLMWEPPKFKKQKQHNTTTTTTSRRTQPL